MNDYEKALQDSLPQMLQREVERQREREMFNCEMHGKSCSYGICDECPLTNPEYGRSK